MHEPIKISSFPVVESTGRTTCWVWAGDTPPLGQGVNYSIYDRRVITSDVIFIHSVGIIFGRQVVDANVVRVAADITFTVDHAPPMRGLCRAVVGRSGGDKGGSNGH
jgi:hypothetical protein